MAGSPPLSPSLYTQARGHMSRGTAVYAAYVRTAWAKGLSSRVVIVRHALRNALIPVVTIGGPLVTGIITGSVVIETIFGVPGLGKEFVESIIVRDYGIVVGLYTFYAILVGLANLGVDLIYPVLDPRIRYS